MPSESAWRVSRTVSVSAQQPVPTSRRSRGRPAETAASSSAIRSSTENELASPVVPKTTRPWQPSSSSQRACATKRSGCGLRSASTGVSTGDQMPLGFCVVRVRSASSVAIMSLRCASPACRTPGDPMQGIRVARLARRPPAVARFGQDFRALQVRSAECARAAVLGRWRGRRRHGAGRRRLPALRTRSAEQSRGLRVRSGPRARCRRAARRRARPARAVRSRLRLLGLEGLEGAQRAPELGERAAAIAQQRVEGCARRCSRGSARARGCGRRRWFSANSSASSRSARSRRQAGGDDPLREHGLERALGRQLLDQRGLECFELGGILARQHDVLLRAKTVLEGVLGGARLAFRSFRAARLRAVAAAGLGARGGKGDAHGNLSRRWGKGNAGRPPGDASLPGYRNKCKADAADEAPAPPWWRSRCLRHPDAFVRRPAAFLRHPRREPSASGDRGTPHAPHRVRGEAPEAAGAGLLNHRCRLYMPMLMLRC